MSNSIENAITHLADIAPCDIFYVNEVNDYLDDYSKSIHKESGFSCSALYNPKENAAYLPSEIQNDFNMNHFRLLSHEVSHAIMRNSESQEIITKLVMDDFKSSKRVIGIFYCLSEVYAESGVEKLSSFYNLDFSNIKDISKSYLDNENCKLSEFIIDSGLKQKYINVVKNCLSKDLKEYTFPQFA